MFFLADAFGAFKEGVATNGLTIATWLPYILTALAVAYPLIQKFSPALAALVAAITKVQSPVTPPAIPATGGATISGVGITDLLGLLGGPHPIIDWFMSLPPEKRAEFFTAVQKRFLPQ